MKFENSEFVKAYENIDNSMNNTIEWDWECLECNNKLLIYQVCDHGDYVIHIVKRPKHLWNIIE